MDVSIIYVNWNCSGEIVESVDTLRKFCTGCTYEIIVVDNNSSEDLAALLQPDIKLIRNEKNLGFGAGCNTGAKAAQGKYLLFLNPDTRLLNDAPGLLYAFMEAHPEAGGAGPMIVQEDDAIYLGGGRRFHTLWYDILEHSSITFRYPQNKIIGAPYYSYWDHNSTRPVESLHGSCMMFSQKAFARAGGFDQRYFLYLEEIDLCRQVWKHGYKIYYVHSAKIMHLGMRSTTKLHGTKDKLYLEFFVSYEKYYEKYYGKLYVKLWKLCMYLIYKFKYRKTRIEIFNTLAEWCLGRVQYNRPNV